MVKALEHLSQLFKSPADAKIARDFLAQKLREPPRWVEDLEEQADMALVQAGTDPDALRAWCHEWLTPEQLRVLRQVLRMASQHQRVYKRTVMLSPRAHILVKTLAEREASNMSEVIERHLDRVLGERYGLALRTVIDERTGQIDHSILPLDGPER